MNRNVGRSQSILRFLSSENQAMLSRKCAPTLPALHLPNARLRPAQHAQFEVIHASLARVVGRCRGWAARTRPPAAGTGIALLPGFLIAQHLADLGSKLVVVNGPRLVFVDDPHDLIELFIRRFETLRGRSGDVSTRARRAGSTGGCLCTIMPRPSLNSANDTVPS
jgi:hypothetical protein